MNRTLSILLIEDDEDDFEITREVLDEIPGTSVTLEWIEAYEPGLARLEAGECDICFIDYRIGGRTGLEFIAMARELGVLIPLVLLTGVGQHDIDVAATEAGASDYLDKSDLDARTLERTIRYSIAHAEAMTALQGKTELLETTLEHAGAGIAALEANGVCTAKNSRFDGMLDVLMGEGPDAGPCNADQTAMLIDRIADSLQGSGTGKIEVEGTDGTVFAVSRTRTPQGGYVYVSLDITQQRAMQDSILKAKGDAEAASRAKSSFFANVSHELRTPLHGIIGFSDLIANESRPETMVEYADQINSCGKSLLGIINAVISFSRIESGQQNFIDDKIIDLAHFIGDTVKPLRPPSSEKSVTLTINIDPELDGIVIDKTALQTMLTGLFDNSVRFSGDAVSIGITGRVCIDGTVVLNFRDDGIGIPADKLERVFDAFYQADDTLDRSYEGIGLGLPMIRLLAHAHDATVDLRSVEGQGTEIDVVFPPYRAILTDSCGAIKPDFDADPVILKNKHAG